MRNLTTTEIAHTNGAAFAPWDLLGTCPYAHTIGWAVLGMAAGASYSHGVLKNAKLLQWTLGSGAVGAAISLGLDYAKGTTPSAA